MFDFAPLARNIIAINKYSKQNFRQALKPFDLTLIDGLVLLSFYGRLSDRIEEKPSASDDYLKIIRTQEELIDEIHCDKSVMTRSMQSLESKGYLVREVNLADRRSFIFRLTTQGFLFKEEITGIVAKWHQVLMAGLDEQELSLLGDSLKKIAGNAINNVIQLRRNS